MADAAGGLGFEPVILGTALEGTARELAGRIGSLAADRAAGGGRVVLIGCGGEASVRLGPDDEFGSGGPNQEVALAAAGSIAGLDVACAFLDTDGSDGGTVLAGAVADGTSAERAAEAAIDLEDALDGHRSGDAVRALRDGIDTGATHTNVNDLFAIAIG